MHVQAWHRLCHGESLEGLGIGLIGGRLDLRNLRLPEAEVTRKIRLPMADLNVLAGTTMIKGVSWRSLDLSSSRLPHIRFLGCEIEDCIFDRAYLEDLRVWSTSFRNVSFRSADMRETSLGSVFEGKINTFENVDFTSADLRRTSWRDARLTGCTFKDAKLRQANFESTLLRDCTFEGELREVTFGHAGREGGAPAPKEMERVDFSRAKLHDCEFRDVDLTDVRLPKDDDHVLIDNYPEALTRLLSFYGNRADLGSGQMAIWLGHDRKWLGPNRKIGIIHKDTIREFVGEEGLQTFMKLVGK